MKRTGQPPQELQCTAPAIRSGTSMIEYICHYHDVGGYSCAVLLVVSVIMLALGPMLISCLHGHFRKGGMVHFTTHDTDGEQETLKVYYVIRMQQLFYVFIFNYVQLPLLWAVQSISKTGSRGRRMGVPET